MTTLTFYGGVGEIGGNKILLEDRDTRLWLDFGLSFGQQGEFYGGFMGPRSKGGIRDLLQMGFVPRLDGIYRDDLVHIREIEGALKELGVEDLSYWAPELLSYEDVLKRDGKPWLTGVLLTHAHLDHCGYIPYLDPRVPIYCSEVTLRVLETMEEISGGEFTAVKPWGVERFKSGFFKGKPSIKGGDEVAREFKPFTPGGTLKIGKLRVQTFAVDHSIPGAVAYLIKTSDGKRVLYTGDLRFHGRQAETTRRLRRALKGAKPDAMVCEGTRVDEPEPDSEERVQVECTEIISKAKGFVGVEFAWKDLTRFETLREAARVSKRTFAISARTAYLLNKLGRGEEVERDPRVKVYVPRKDSMTYSPGDYSRSKYIAGFSSDWEEGEPDTRHLENGIRAYRIKADSKRYLVHLTTWDFNELIDLRPPEGGLFISASSEPYDEEGMIEEERKKAWMRLFRLNPPDHELPHIHASGHASGPELKAFVREVGPEVLFPIHTEHPEMFKGLAGQVHERIELGKAYEIQVGQKRR
jgi:ribonuclease J